ncbi:MAG: flagellar biosynthesis protein FlhB [Clostridia bacterium]|nr:flagellar biosynthesis protein FlhB [Clostridia bacterium]MDD4047611.1 flagellar biosynthesis protein FlhB [Clostridia bacterium]
MLNLKINLQLFAGEKTEDATSHKKRDARKKGQIVKSNEVITVIVLALSFLALKNWLPYMGDIYEDFFLHVFEYTIDDLTIYSSMLLVCDIIVVIIKMVGPVILMAMVAGYIANIIQIGFLFTTEPLKFDPTRLNPVKGLKRIFSKRTIAELIKTLFKMFLVGFVAFYFLYKKLPRLSATMGYSINVALSEISDVIFTTGWRILIVLLVIAVADYAFQVYDYEQSLKMSKQEVKDEYKTIDGDPQIKSKIKEKQRQMATQRMMQDVPKATVVITNPTHFAIALKYNDEMQTPIVVAKGQDYIAQKIKEVARNSNVVIVENKKLARVLYKEVKIGMPIPIELFKAVAEVLAYVYKLKRHF